MVRGLGLHLEKSASSAGIIALRLKLDKMGQPCFNQRLESEELKNPQKTYGIGV
ncbi:MAG: hypothetical protein VKL59_24785 [Nostocaceae cyanobacterium]|nr:hypothetical protein [Nostocaceae cyanobacterium]